MDWTPLNFSKNHRGRTLPQVALSDPDWFFWAYEEGVFSKFPHSDEAEIVYRRARSIRIPKRNHDAQYLVHGPTGTFATMLIVPKTQETHVGGSPVHVRLDWIDLAVPRQIKEYDKLGCRRLVAEMKEVIFGSSSVRLTRKRCEEFFNDASNFVSP